MLAIKDLHLSLYTKKKCRLLISFIGAEPMEVRVDHEDLKACFEGLQDPRVIGRTTHPLEAILFLTLCAVLCGMDDWESIEQRGNNRVQWLSQLIEVSNGIPSHDTISRVFAASRPIMCWN